MSFVVDSPQHNQPRSRCGSPSRFLRRGPVVAASSWAAGVGGKSSSLQLGRSGVVGVVGCREQAVKNIIRKTRKRDKGEGKRKQKEWAPCVRSRGHMAGGYHYNQPPEPCFPQGSNQGNKKNKKGGVVLSSACAEGVEVALLRLFLYQKTKAACLRAVNAIRYPPQDPAMMRLEKEKKKKPVTELAVIAVVSQNKNRKSRKSDEK